MNYTGCRFLLGTRSLDILVENVRNIQLNGRGSAGDVNKFEFGSFGGLIPVVVGIVI